MKRIVLPLLALGLGGAFLHDVSRAHGGSYRGPGDTVPPGGGGGGGGGGTGPGMPGPSGPGSGGPGGGTGPGTGVPTGGGPGRPGSVGTGAMASGPDLTTWEFWWGFNKEQYLNLKAHVHDGGLVTDSDGFFSGSTKPRDTLRPSDETIRTKIVPALLEALRTERANDIVSGALVALAKTGDVRAEDGSSEIEPVIARFLADPSQEIAETSVIALGILESEASIPLLQDLVLDTRNGRARIDSSEVPYRTRAFAAYALGLIGARVGDDAMRRRIVAVLADVLTRQASNLRDVHVAAVDALGLVPIDLDPSESPDGIADAAASRQSQIRLLRRMMRDSSLNDVVRAHVPIALARLLDGVPEGIRESVAEDLILPLGRHSKDSDPIRQSCVLALGMIGDCDADLIDVKIREAVARMAIEGDVQSRNFTNIAFGQIGGRTGAGKDAEIGRREAREFLLAQLGKGRHGMKPWAAIGIGVMEHALTRSAVTGGSASGTAKAVVRKALGEATSPDHVGAFAIALGIAGDEEARRILMDKFAATSEPNSRGYVAIALGLVDSRESIPSIQAVVRDAKYRPDLLKSAAIGLGLLGDKELVPELCRMLGEAQGLSSQAAIASALGFIGDSRSVDPLVDMLKRKQGLTDAARGFAAVALGIVADKEPLPWNAKISTDMNYRASTSTLTGGGGTGVLDIL